jgi:hypothetical protein
VVVDDVDCGLRVVES